MSDSKFNAEEVAELERALAGVALVNPMLGGAVAIKALGTRVAVEAELPVDWRGLTISWDKAGPYGAVQRSEDGQ